MEFFTLGQSALNSSAVLGKSGISTKYKAMVYHDGSWHYCSVCLGPFSAVALNGLIDSNGETLYANSDLIRYKTIIYK